MISITINELFNMVRKDITHKKYNELEIYNKDGWIIYPDTIPDNFNFWDVKDKYGWSVAHEAAYKGFLPDDFDQWEIKNFNGWSVAHVAASNNHLPKNFNQWTISDKYGWSVAHEVAKHNKLPDDFDQWDITDNQGHTVRFIFWEVVIPENFEGLDV